MAFMVEQNENIYNDEDDSSETSTLKYFFYRNPEKFHRYINSASFIGNEIYRCGDFESNSSDIEHDDDELSENKCNSNSSSFPFKKVCRIDMSPEAERKRREAYNNWLKIVNERDKERKRLQKKRIETMRQRQCEEEEIKKLNNDLKVKEWNEKKRLEAENKICRVNKLKEAYERKMIEPKQYKKAMKFDEWIAKKNEEFKKFKAQQAQEKIKIKNYIKSRECKSAVSYEKWMQSSKYTAKPVPLNRGLESLRGSTTKLYVNPAAWN